MPITNTAQVIVDQALNELSLPTSVIGSTQATQLTLQASAMMNTIGQDATKVHDWQFLEKVATFTGDGVTTSWDMPADFGRVVNQTEWSTNFKRPMIGPLTAQEWGWTQYGIVSVGVYYRYRILDGKFTVYPTPANGDVFNFFYISKNWVTDNTGLPKDMVTSADDVPMFDWTLMVAALKVRLWGIQGFDTTLLSQEYNYRLQVEKGQNQGAAAINLSGGPAYHYIDGSNVPDGSWIV